MKYIKMLLMSCFVTVLFTVTNVSAEFKVSEFKSEYVLSESNREEANAIYKTLSGGEWPGALLDLTLIKWYNKQNQFMGYVSTQKNLFNNWVSSPLVSYT